MERRRSASRTAFGGLRLETGLAVAVLAGAIVGSVPTLRAEPTGGSTGEGTGAGEAEFRVLSRDDVSDAGADETAQRPGPTRAGPSRLASPLPTPLRRAVAQREWERAKGQLDALAGRGLEAVPDFQFLAGYLAGRLGQTDRAYRVLTSIGPRLARLENYARFFAARAALEGARPHRAVTSFSRVSTDSLLVSEALIGTARALSRAGGESPDSPGRLRRIARVAETYIDRAPEAEQIGDARMMAGRARAGLGDWERAADHLFGLLRSAPLSDAADRARAFLEDHASELPDRYRGWLDSEPAKLRMARYRAMFERHRSEALIEALEPRVEQWTEGARRWCRATYWLGRSMTKLRRHGDSVDWYRRLADECRGVGPYGRKALYLGGLGFWNANQRDSALQYFGRLRESYPEHSYADDTMYFSARIHREAGRDDRAGRVLRRQVERYPDGDMAADAHWLLVRRMFEEGDYAGAARYVGQLDSTGERRRTVRGRLRYFRARALWKVGDRSAAREVYREVIRSHPLGYYALLAANRLAGGASGRRSTCGSGEADLRVCAGDTNAAGVPSPTVVPPSIRGASHFRTGLELLRLGLEGWAEAEFDEVLGRRADRPAVVWSLANLYDVAGAHATAHRLPDRLSRWRTSYPGGGPIARRWEIAYPRGSRQAVSRWAGRRSLSESLVFALIRRESGFDADVASWANAVGLMQLMPDTAAAVAERAGVEGEVEARLTDAEFNVRLGTAYLAELRRRFEGRLPLMVAGYNGGEENVSRWIDERPEVPLDLWIEDIPYGQTRKYAKIVMADLWVYRYLYGQRQVPEVSLVPPGEAVP